MNVSPQALFVIRNAGEAFFPPLVCPRTGVVMRKTTPGVSALAVILPDGSPLAFAQVGSPFLPGSLLRSGLFKSGLFSGFHDCGLAEFEQEITEGTEILFSVSVNSVCSC